MFCGDLFLLLRPGVRPCPLSLGSGPLLVFGPVAGLGQPLPGLDDLFLEGLLVMLALALRPLVLLLPLFGDPFWFRLLAMDFLVVLGACPLLLPFPGLGLVRLPFGRLLFGRLRSGQLLL